MFAQTQNHVESFSNSWKGHQSHGHLNFQYLKILSTHNMVRGLLSMDKIKDVCKECISTQQTRALFLLHRCIDQIEL